MSDNQDDDVLFNLEFQIEDDKTDNITIRENDDIEEVVDKFCQDNDYGDNIKKIIMNQIVAALDQNIEDLENEEGVKESSEKEENKADSDQEYDEYMNNKNAENILTSGTYEQKEDEKAKTKSETKSENNSANNSVKHDSKNDSERRSQSPEFVNYQCNTEYIDDNSEYVIHNNSHLENSKFNMNKTVNIPNDKESSHSQSNLTNLILPTTPKDQAQTPRSENSFSNFVEKEKPRRRKIESKKNSISKNYYTEATTNNTSSLNNSRPTKTYSRFSTTPDKLPGERLYFQFIDKLPKKKDQIKRIKEERKRSELREVRSIPSIDRMSDKMASNSPIRKTLDKVEDRLINYGELRREKLTEEMTRKKLEQYDHSYHPTVGEKSQILASIKRKQRLDTLSKTGNSQLNKTFDAVSNIEDQIASDEELRPMQKNMKASFLSSNNTFTNMKVKTESNYSQAINKNVIRKNEGQKDNSKYERYNTFTSQSEVTIKTPSRSKSKTGRSRTPLRKDTSFSLKEQRPKTPLKLNPDKSIHDYLYVESKLIKDKKKQEETQVMKKVCPFKPTIPDSSKKLVNRKETKDQFIKRLVNSKKETEELVVNLKKNANKNGNLFKPTVGRAPKDPKTREVTVNLDGYYDKKLLSNQYKLKDEAYSSNLEKKKLFMEKSMNSILKMKIDRYKQIFDMLDSDSDGVISSKNIRLSTLDAEMLKMLTPILENIQKNNLNMNFKEFCLTADQFLSVKIFGGSGGVIQVKQAAK